MTARTYDGNGWIEIKNNPISKVGVFPYLGRSISAELEPDKIYMVYRSAAELSHPDCIESMKLIPWVDLHPTKLLGPEDTGRMPAENKGIEGTTGEDVYFEGDTLFANIKMFTDNIDRRVNIEGIRELSLGYGCKYEISDGVFNGQPYQVIQRNIRGNHLASVPEGRMGPDVAVLDHLTFTFDAKDIEMTDEEKKMKECADRAAKDGFSRYSKDADEEEKERKEKEAADKMARDAEEKSEKEKADKEAADKAARDAEEEKKDKEKGEGMDAKITGLRSELETLRSGGIKAVLKEVKNRDALYGRLSGFVGAFDHSEMTTEEVAEYGVEKLGLKCAKGSEMAALDGYLHGRTLPHEEVGYSLDSAQRAPVGDTAELDALFNPA